MPPSPDTPPLPDAVPAPGRRTLWQRIATRQFLFISVAVHLLLAGGASVFYIKSVGARPKTSFAAPPAPSGQSSHATEHKVQMQKKQQSMSAPAQMRRVTTTAANTQVALPQMPLLPVTAGRLSPVKMAGMGGSGTGLGLGGGAGGGSGSGGGGPALFGLRQKAPSALVGTFYDFKQTPDGKPTNMGIKDEAAAMSAAERPANEESSKLVGRFAAGGFNEGLFSQYFKGPAPLYATQLFIPVIASENGPKEFGLGERVRGRRWVAVYRGRVTAPESGRYHFVGLADDYLVVRLRHGVVLDGSLSHPTGKKPVRELFFDGLGGSYRADEGDAFNVTAGEAYDLEVLIGEQPGGQFCAYLLLEKDGAEYAKDSKGNPVLPVFKVAPGSTEHTGDSIPVTAADTSWSVWKAEKEQSSL